MNNLKQSSSVVKSLHSKKTFPEKIYSPASPLRQPWVLVREMIADLLASRELAWRLLVRNISAQYRQSLLGYCWAFLPPLFNMAIWVFLNSKNIIRIEDPGIPYPVFVLVGTVLWQLFTESLNSPLRSVNDSRGMLSKINFPREALVLAGVGEVLFNFAIRVVLLITIFLWFGMPLPKTILLVPLGLVSLVGLGLMIGVILTPLGTLYADVGRGVMFATQFWFFLTPVVYPMPQEGAGAFLTQWNPVSFLLLTTRDWMTTGASEHLTGFVIVSALSLVLLMFGWLLYRISMPHIIARMSA